LERATWLQRFLEQIRERSICGGADPAEEENVPPEYAEDEDRDFDLQHEEKEKHRQESLPSLTEVWNFMFHSAAMEHLREGLAIATLTFAGATPNFR
jgi:hypothetical protein